MRILGFSKKWPKLEQEEFTTFRFPRKDRDWGVGEVVQIVFKPRGKDKEVLGVARISSKEKRWAFDSIFSETGGILHVSLKEAVGDGFSDIEDMTIWLFDTYKERFHDEPMNKLTLRWLRERG